MTESALTTIAIGASVVSGMLDSVGFVYATKAFKDGKVMLNELAFSVGSFAIGLAVYYLSAKFFSETGGNSPMIQSLIWYISTVVGISVLSGEFWQWPLPQKAVSLIVVAGLGWLLSQRG